MIVSLSLTACWTKKDNTFTDKPIQKDSDTISILTICYKTVNIDNSDSIHNEKVNLNKSKSNYIDKNVKIKTDSTRFDTTFETSCYITVPQSNYIKPDEDTIYDVVDKMPEFPGGHEEMLIYFNNKMSDQQIGLCYVAITGRVICRFVI